MSKKENSKLYPTDIWLLLSIQYANKKATKEKIIAAGDFINHAIFTEHEFDEGIKRLTDNEYVIENGEKYSVSEKFEKIWLKKINKYRNVHKQLLELEKTIII